MIQTLLILTSPPASGKTYWIEKFHQAYGRILVISPLRALANECKEKWGEKIQVMTPEEWLVKQEIFSVVIFDEFHLLFYWGDSFRQKMWEAFYQIGYQASLVMGLTATLSAGMREEVSKLSSHFDEILWIDCGNQKLKYSPTRYVYIPEKQMMRELIELPSTGVKLVFCAYRNEVLKLTEELRAKGNKVWGLVGGEAHKMQALIQSGDKVDFIVATTVLSHGVNLPKISEIYFLYELKNIDFWIQMVARGGRKGEDFRVYALEKPYGISWSRIINFLFVLLLRIKLCFNSMKGQFYLWFLKD
ncbi:MAG: DEAD/DEAH box helicase [Bacteriovoracaceae bacterium]